VQHALNHPRDLALGSLLIRIVGNQSNDSGHDFTSSRSGDG